MLNRIRIYSCFLFLASVVSPLSKVSASPISEFATTKEIFISELLASDYKAEEFIRELRTTKVPVNIITAKQFELSSPWIRDYSPIATLQKRSTGNEIVLADFKVEQSRGNDDSFPTYLTKSLNMPHTPIDASLDGGNLLTNGSKCFLVGATKPLTEALKEKLGCKEVVSFEEAPHPHIDMFAKIINEKTVLVSEITAETIAFIKKEFKVVPYEVEELKLALDQASKIFGKHLKVVRIPMPMPFRNTFRNYTNSLLINGTAIIPSYKNFGWNYGRYPDEKLHATYEKKVAETFSKYGFKPRFANADGLIYGGGAFHCAAFQLPSQ